MLSTNPQAFRGGNSVLASSHSHDDACWALISNNSTYLDELFAAGEGLVPAPLFLGKTWANPASCSLIPCDGEGGRPESK